MINPESPAALNEQTTWINGLAAGVFAGVAARVRRAEAESDQRIAVAAVRKALALPQLNTQTTHK